ncbi:unnamed protein product [Ectocarpus sp. 12 AP-2014]
MWDWLARHVRLVMVWAMLMPFAVSSLIASGVMPARADNGAFMMVICTGDGMVEVAVDPVTLQPISDESGGTDPQPTADHCAWAAAHAPADLADAMALRLPLAVIAPAQAAPDPTVLRVAAATGLPPSTGPPLPF